MNSINTTVMNHQDTLTPKKFRQEKGKQFSETNHKGAGVGGGAGVYSSVAEPLCMSPLR
jgi:hypothetical protein